MRCLETNRGIIKHDISKFIRNFGVVESFIVMTFLVRECHGSPKKHKNSLKFLKIRADECFDKVLNEEFKKNLMCKMKNVIIREPFQKSNLNHETSNTRP
jgi:hypothetical protein